MRELYMSETLTSAPIGEHRAPATVGVIGLGLMGACCVYARPGRRMRHGWRKLLQRNAISLRKVTLSSLALEAGSLMDGY